MNGRDLVLPGVASVPPRAELVEVPNRRGVYLEVRPCTLMDRLHYVGQIAMAENEDNVSSRILWPILVIPSTWSPKFDKQGLCLAGESNQRVFHWTDRTELLNAHGQLLELLFNAAVRMCGLSNKEEKAAFWRLANDFDFGTLMNIAYEWHLPLSELAARMPSYELTWWRAYIGKRNADMELDRAQSEGKSDPSFQLPD